jgi:MFS family permease
MLLGGAIGDRFGPKRILTVACLLAGLAGALRGLSTDLTTLTITILMFPMNVFKACGAWFPRRQLGLANGVISMGMALGFMLGSMISATVMSPLLGGWRPVLVFYGLLAITISIPWYFTRPAPAAESADGVSNQKSLRQAVVYVAKIRNIWLLGLAILGIGGCIQGTLGYLPLYLRGQGWPEASADGALSVFHLASMLFVIPIALLSDRLGTRKKVLMVASLMIISGVSLLSVADGAMVWVAVCMAGMVRDGFMAVFFTMILETEGIGVAFAGTASGLVMVFSGLGSVLAPPVGNSLAAIAPGLPFLFWAALALLGLFGLYMAQEVCAAAPVASQPSPQAG